MTPRSKHLRSAALGAICRDPTSPCPNSRRSPLFEGAGGAVGWSFSVYRLVNSQPLDRISGYASTTSWLYKNNSCVFIDLLALIVVGKCLPFVFNNLLASFGTFALVFLTGQSIEVKDVDRRHPLLTIAIGDPGP